MKLSWLYFFKERLTGDRRPSVAAWLGSFLVPFFHSQGSFLLADKRLPCYVWVVAPGTQGKSPMDLRQIAQELRVSGPLSPESFYASLNKKGIVAAENRWKIALTLCKLCELSKNVSVACQAIFAKYMYWFFFLFSDVDGDRIRTKVHLEIVGKFCRAEVTPGNVFHRRLMFYNPSFRISYCVNVSYKSAVWF